MLAGIFDQHGIQVRIHHGKSNRIQFLFPTQASVLICMVDLAGERAFAVTAQDHVAGNMHSAGFGNRAVGPDLLLRGIAPIEGGCQNIPAVAVHVAGSGTIFGIVGIDILLHVLTQCTPSAGAAQVGSIVIQRMLQGDLSFCPLIQAAIQIQVRVVRPFRVNDRCVGAHYGLRVILIVKAVVGLPVGAGAIPLTHSDPGAINRLMHATVLNGQTHDLIIDVGNNGAAGVAFCGVSRVLVTNGIAELVILRVAHRLTGGNQLCITIVIQVACDQADTDLLAQCALIQIQRFVRLEHIAAGAPKDHRSTLVHLQLGKVPAAWSKTTGGNSQIVHAIPVEVTGSQGDHVGDLVGGIAENMAPGTAPLVNIPPAGIRGFRGLLELKDVHTGITVIGNVSGDFRDAVAVVVTRGDLQQILPGIVIAGMIGTATGGNLGRVKRTDLLQTAVDSVGSIVYAHIQIRLHGIGVVGNIGITHIHHLAGQTVTVKVAGCHCAHH